MQNNGEGQNLFIPSVVARQVAIAVPEGLEMAMAKTDPSLFICSP